MTASIRDALAGLVAREALAPAAELERWRTGPGEDGVPAAVVFPEKEEEVARILAMASEEGWRIQPAGLGQWLEGGGASDVAVVVSTGRMKEVAEYEPADLTFSAGAGLSLAALRETTAPHGQWLPLDPPGAWEGSLGAMVALGVGGPLRHLYGTPSDHVLGLTVVSGDGRILRWGGKVVKNVAGFDLTRLNIGSWGSLGIVTSASARLFPIPEEDVTLVLPGRHAKALLPVARTMALSPLPLAAVELLDPLGVVDSGDVPNGVARSGFTRVLAEEGRPAGASLVLRLLGSRAQVTAMEERLRSDLSSEGGRVLRLDGVESRALHAALGQWESGSDLVARMCLFPSALGVLIEEAENLRKFATTFQESPTVGVSAHVGAGILRVAVRGFPGEPAALVPWVANLRKLRARLEDRGGTLTLSVGPTRVMNEVGAWGAAGGEQRLMKGLKAEFDPKGILAPGRLGL